MKIENYAAESAFAPEAVAVMSEAFDRATKLLALDPNQETQRDIVAQLVVQAARFNRDLDASGLCKRVVHTYALWST
jgi:hypothetical protein